MKSFLDDAESRLIGDIYDAAMAPELWPQVLRQIVTLSESNSGIITALDTLNPDYTFAFTHNIPAHALEAYRDEGLDAFEMEFHGRPMISKGVGSALLSTEVYGSQEEYIRRGGEFYRRCLQPSRIHYLAATLLDHADFRWGALGIHRPEEWAPLTSEHTALLCRLTPHVRRALQIHRQLTAVQRHNAQLYRMLDGLAAGVLLVNPQGRVRYCNSAAEGLLRQHDSLRVTQRAELQAADPLHDAQLQALLRHAISTGQREAIAAVSENVIGLMAGQKLLMLTVTPLSEMTGYCELTSDGVAAAVFLTDPAARHTLSRKLLQESYRLSERECELCEAFVNHASFEGAATACGLSLASVRTYMKSIYEKTGQHSQAELMRLLLGLTLDFQHIR